MRRHRPLTRRAPALLVAVLLVASACSDDGDGASPPTTDAPVDVVSVALEGEPADYEVLPSVEQLLVRGAEPGQELVVATEAGDQVAEGVADDAGNLLVRDLDPGGGYRVVSGEEGSRVVSDPEDVWAVEDAPEQSLYDSQELVEGYQYLETRDGTTLAIHVSLPGPIEDGPYPTVIEYSGYDPANPDGLQPSKLIANMLGYASVGVNMRGTGCSGGSFLFFEPAQVTDGYDAIEVVAAQDWVEGGRVGMVGLSYPGISQLFVAQSQPPSLAAIAPLSVIEDTYRSTLYPGGVLNDGFATSWAEGRQRDGEPGGQGWSQVRMDDGDEVCVENQELRTQNPDLFDFIEDARYVPEDLSGYLGGLAPRLFVDQIEVPVFLAGAWQDEQTGGRFPTMLDRFTSAPVTRFTMLNGGHVDPFSPEVLLRWTEFLDLYVAERVPRLPEGIGGPLNLLGGAVFGSALEMPEQRFLDVDDHAEALARFEADQPVRILFEHGTGAEPGAPVPGFEASFDAWPIPETEPTTWYLAPGGGLVGDAPGEEVTEAYRYDTSRSQQITLPDGGSPWVAEPGWQWDGPEEGSALSYVTEPLTETLVMAGTGRVDLRFGSTAPDVDVQVTLSEVRPDGTEVFVQGGWLRASHRTLDEELSGELRAEPTHLEADAADLPDGELVDLPVGLFPFAHVFREGSSIRISVETPGGTRPEWTWAVLDAPEGTENQVGLGGSAASASRITLPVIPDIEVPTPLPACGAQRGQPCRPYTGLS